MGDAASSSDALRERVRNDSVALFMAHWRASLAAIVLITVAVAFAGEDLVPERTRWIWGGLLVLNYLLQGSVMLQMERAPTLALGIERWMPWLLASIFASGVGWGALPWLLERAPVSILLLATAFNAMMIFCVVNAPATATMQAFAVAPVALVNTAALLAHATLPYAWPIAIGFMALCGVILVFGIRVQSALRDSMRERHLARDLALELGRQQQRLVEMERERTLLLERQRLMQDMHDGLGASLLSALAQVERGQLQADDLAQTLRECLDDLRIVIDSLEPMDNDLVALLATMRFRVGRRLEQAGVQLEWSMQDLPPLEWLGPPEALQVMRLVQEALSNVIQHAQARRVRIAAARVEQAIEVSIGDDGRGFDASMRSSAGRGLRSLVQRAQRLGGEVEVTSSPGFGTQVLLRLPLARMA